MFVKERLERLRAGPVERAPRAIGLIVPARPHQPFEPVDLLTEVLSELHGGIIGSLVRWTSQPLFEFGQFGLHLSLNTGFEISRLFLKGF